MLTINSTYSLKRRGLLSLESERFLYDIYLPLIGYKGVFIYCLLVNEYLSSRKEGDFKYILEKSGLTLTNFINHKKTLESLGLIQTLENEDNYIFVLKSVLTPNDFFENPVLKGLYVNKVGKSEATRIMKYYEIDEVDFEKYTDISAGVKESFEINFDSSDVNLNNEKKLVTVNKNIIKDKFADGVLIENIVKLSNLNIHDLTTKDISSMHQIGTLYGLNEKIMAQILIDGYRDSNPKGSKIDIEYCKERAKKEVSLYRVSKAKTEKISLSGTTNVAEKINYYENISPRDFLKEKQNGVAPIKSDLNIIASLSDNFGLQNGMINILVEYSLMHCDSKLVKNYIEKVASTIQRKGIRSSLELYDYLFGNDKSKNNGSKFVKIKKESDDASDKIDEELENLL